MGCTARSPAQPHSTARSPGGVLPNRRRSTWPRAVSFALNLRRVGVRSNESRQSDSRGAWPFHSWLVLHGLGCVLVLPHVVWLILSSEHLDGSYGSPMTHVVTGCWSSRWILLLASAVLQAVFATCMTIIRLRALQLPGGMKTQDRRSNREQ